MEALQYNLLFRWFVCLDLNPPVWDVSVFTKNRDRLLGGAVATAFFEQVLAQAKAQRLLSDEHFTVGWHADRGLDGPGGQAVLSGPCADGESMAW